MVMYTALLTLLLLSVVAGATLAADHSSSPISDEGRQQAAANEDEQQEDPPSAAQGTAFQGSADDGPLRSLLRDMADMAAAAAAGECMRNLGQSRSFGASAAKRPLEDNSTSREHLHVPLIPVSIPTRAVQVSRSRRPEGAERRTTAFLRTARPWRAPIPHLLPHGITCRCPPACWR